jgi:hypothetical protein
MASLEGLVAFLEGLEAAVDACLGWLEVPLDGLSGYLEGLGW